MRIALLASLACLAISPGVAAAKKHSADDKASTEQTARAISELAGKFTWGMTPRTAMNLVTDDMAAQADVLFRKEPNAAKQDKLRQDLAAQIKKVRESYIKFEGQKTNWDVSIIDHEFGHKNDEAMFVVGEKDQRRFLFFYRDRLWKQFIAFNAENPVFAGKTFDDFAGLIQKRYGQAAMTFKKLRTSEEQTLDHLEWAPSGDFVLWAIDLTFFYGNYCLSLMQRSTVDEIVKGRHTGNSDREANKSMVNDLTKRGNDERDSNADVVDEITGRPASVPTSEPPPSEQPKTKAGKTKTDEAPRSTETNDPLEGTKF